MKHFVLTLLGLLSFCLAIRAEVYSGECGDNGNNLTWTLDTETGKLVISGNGAMTQNPWRDYRNYIRTVDIQEGVTSIVNSAFADCSNLTNATIAASVTRINYYAFLDCISLSNITIPNNATYIGSSAFEGCTNLLNIIIPCTTIESYAFQHCTNLKKITIKNGVKEIKKGAFDNCTSIEKVIVEDGEETLTLGAGGGYNNGLFHNSPIKNLYIGRNLEYNTTSDYGYSPFYALRTILSLNIGSQVSLLKDNAFNNCTNLNSITCQNSNPPICGTNTFTSVNTSTCKLSVPKSSVNTYKSTNPWSDFKNIVTFSPFSGEVEIDGINYELNGETKQATVIAKSSGKYSGEVVIPESVEHEGTAYSVTSIGDWAFEDCSGLTSVTIPNSVTSIGEDAFYKCSGLTSVHISDIAAWCNIDFDNSYSNPLRYAHHLYLNGEEVKDLVIPNSVTSIEYSAFYGCSGLTSVTIPNSVTSIGSAAFYYCSGLTSVTIGNSVTSIGGSAFYGCSGLTSVTIPNSVTSIGNRTFYECSGLTSVTIGNSVTSIGKEAFWNCESLTSVTIPNSVTSIGESAFCNCSGLTSVTIPNSVTSIGESAFTHCSDLTSVHISDIAAWCNIDFAGEHSNPLSFAHHLYLNREEVKDLVIPNSVTSIRARAFEDYSGLTSVTIPNSVTSIGDHAFSNCSGLTSVTIPNSMTSIGEYAFWCCSGLTSVTIPNSVTSIGELAFYRCSGLTSVSIGNSVESIGGYAFDGCSKLIDVYCYAEKVPYTYSYAFESSRLGYITLHVPAASIESYKTTAPWSSFGAIKALPQAMTIVDGELFENDEEQTLSTLTYTRTLPNLYWNALYVPFEIPVSEIIDKYEVAYVNNVNSYDHNDDGTIDDMRMEVIKIKSGTLNANYPYLIKARNDEARSMNLTLENTTLFQSVETTIDCSSVFAKHEITGIYNKRYKDELPEGAMAISMAGAWQPIASGSYLNPFRLYMTITARDGSPVKVEPAAMSRIRISVLGEDVETDIEETRSETKNIILDLSGRSVLNPVKGGVYIVNGKKVIF